MALINVWVAYALPEKQWITRVQVSEKSTVADVLLQCKHMEPFSNVDLEQHKMGIYGKEVPRDQEMKENDRIEIYRPLIRDPKTARRMRAAQKNKR